MRRVVIRAAIWEPSARSGPRGTGGLMREMVSRRAALTGPIFGTATSRSNTSALAT
jgi:hypothetical protein